MAKAELGTKRVCPTTGRKFYDLNKDPVDLARYRRESFRFAVLPHFATPTRPWRRLLRSRPRSRRPEPADVELVSLEEADAEAEGGKKEPVAEGEEEDVEVADGGAEDDTFLETDEDEGDDVSDIVGGEREDEEDT